MSLYLRNLNKRTAGNNLKLYRTALFGLCSAVWTLVTNLTCLIGCRGNVLNLKLPVIGILLVVFDFLGIDLSEKLGYFNLVVFEDIREKSKDDNN